MFLTHYLKTIRGQILFSFFTFLIFTGGFIFVADYYFESKEMRAQHILQTLEEIDLHTQTAKRLEYVFLTDETINEDFYKTQKSQILTQRITHINQIKEGFIFLQKIKSLQSEDIRRSIETLNYQFSHYEQMLKELINLIQQKGFKNYGLEGKMRQYVHDLENANLNLVKILTIRRHEKDFMLRKQKPYIKKWQEAVIDLKTDLKNNPLLLDLLRKYEITFESFAHIEEKIGLSDKEGLKKQLFLLAQTNDKINHKVNQQVKKEVAYLKFQNEMARLGVFVMGLGLFLVVAFYVTRFLSKPITNLSGAIHQIVESNLTENPKIIQIETNNEIGQLSQDIAYLVKTVQESMSEIQSKSDKVAEKHRILMEGVQYAQRIQRAILPDFELGVHFKNHFLFYKPQFTVSGDFYWFSEIENTQFVAVVDCTGRGVSGALMSLIGYSLLNKIVNEKRISDTELILETLHTELQMAFGQNRYNNDDRMDVCFCKINPHPNKENHKLVTFSGANRPLFYANGWDICEIQGTSRPIGGDFGAKMDNFKSTTFELKTGNSLYLTTNGFINQLNPQRQTFSITRFKELLQKTVHLSALQQLEKFELELANHAGNTPQRDDITVLAVKI